MPPIPSKNFGWNVFSSWQSSLFSSLCVSQVCLSSLRNLSSWPSAHPYWRTVHYPVSSESMPTFSALRFPRTQFLGLCVTMYYSFLHTASDKINKIIFRNVHSNIDISSKSLCEANSSRYIKQILQLLSFKKVMQLYLRVYHQSLLLWIHLCNKKWNFTSSPLFVSSLLR